MGKIDINLWMDGFKAKLKEGKIAKEELYRSVADVADQYIIHKMKEYDVPCLHAIPLKGLEEYLYGIDDNKYYLKGFALQNGVLFGFVDFYDGKGYIPVKIDKTILDQFPTWFYQDLMKNDDWFVLSKMYELKDGGTKYNGLLSLCDHDEKLRFCIKISDSDKQEKRVLNSIIKQSMNCFGYSYGRNIGAFISVAPGLEWTGLVSTNGHRVWDEDNFAMPSLIRTSFPFRKSKSTDHKFTYEDITIGMIANYLNNVSTIFPNAKLDFVILSKDAAFVSDIKDMTGKFLLCTKRKYSSWDSEYIDDTMESFNSEQEAIGYLCKGEHEIKSLSLDALKTIDSGYEFVSFIPYRQIELK